MYLHDECDVLYFDWLNGDGKPEYNSLDRPRRKLVFKVKMNLDGTGRIHVGLTEIRAPVTMEFKFGVQQKVRDFLQTTEHL
jgi:hypothetical protein